MDLYEQPTGSFIWLWCGDTTDWPLSIYATCLSQLSGNPFLQVSSPVTELLTRLQPSYKQYHVTIIKWYMMDSFLGRWHHMYPPGLRSTYYNSLSLLGEYFIRYSTTSPTCIYIYTAWPQGKISSSIQDCKFLMDYIAILVMSWQNTEYHHKFSRW